MSKEVPNAPTLFITNYALFIGRGLVAQPVRALL